MNKCMVFMVALLVTAMSPTLWAQPAEDGAARPGRGGGRGPEFRQRLLDEFDADGDGEFSEEERQAARDAMGGRRGRGRGAQDRTGQRGPRDPNEVFDQFDEDGDGMLSRDEFVKLTEFQRARRAGRGGAGRQGGQGRGAGLGPGLGQGRGPRVDAADRPGPPADRSFRPQRPLGNQFEDPAGPPPERPRPGQGPGFGPPRGDRPGAGLGGMPDPDQVFDRFDSDGDGYLSRDEFAALTETVRGRMGGRGQGLRRGFGQGPPEGRRGGRGGPNGFGRPARPELDPGADQPTPEESF